MKRDEALALDRQLCFPLYVLSKELTKLYHQMLAPLDLTYTQYIVMLVMWEEVEIDMRAMGQRLHLNSNTLTPLLTRLAEKDYIVRRTARHDARHVTVTLTARGESLRDEAQSIPRRIRELIPLDSEELAVLHRVLYRAIDGIASLEHNE